MAARNRIKSRVRRWVFLGILVGLGIAITYGVLSGFLPHLFKKYLDPSSIDAQQVGNTAQLIDNGMVTDAFGNYQRTKIDPSKIAITSNSSGKYSAAEVEAAKHFIVDFVATEAIDSIALDNPTQLDTWRASVALKYIHPSYLKDVLYGNGRQQPDNSVSNFGLILSNAKNSEGETILPPLMRDGKPRVANKSFGDKVEFKDGPNGSLLAYLRGSASFYATDEAVLSHYSTGKLSQYVDENNKTVQLSPADAKASLKKSYPSLSDGKPQAGSLVFDLHFGLLKDGDKWKIVDFSNLFESKRTSWLDSSTSSEFHYRDEVSAR